MHDMHLTYSREPWPSSFISICFYHFDFEATIVGETSWCYSVEANICSWTFLIEKLRMDDENNQQKPYEMHENRVAHKNEYMSKFFGIIIYL